MPSFPHCLPPDRLSLKFSVRAPRPKLSPGSTSPGSLDAVAVKKNLKKRHRDGASWKMAPERAREQRRVCDSKEKELGSNVVMWGGRTLRRCIKVRGRHLCDKRWEAGQWWKETMLVNKAEQMSRWWWMSDSEKTGPAWAAAPALSERANASHATSTLIIHQPRY